LKISPKSIFEEGQTSREWHEKQAVPDSKARACHATEVGEVDRKAARPCHMCSSGTAAPALHWCSSSLNIGVFVMFVEQLLLARFSFVAAFFFLSNAFVKTFLSY